jgi:FKBP-type peptidyl-prolyl cis-trans isomerase
MKTSLKLTVILMLIISATACTDGQLSKDHSLSSRIDSVSYALGYQRGTFLNNEGFEDLSVSDYMTGFSAGQSQDSAAMTDEEMFNVITNFQREVQEQIGQDNITEGEEFLEANKKKEGVQVTDSGLQYKVIKEGEGISPSSTDVVQVHYVGSLIDGREFESSRKAGQPATFPLNRVIPGWTEGVQLMKEGAIYEFYIPYNLAYGNRGPNGSMIGPFETLIFEIELLKVNP